MNELWAPIAGTSRYEVSSLGNVRAIGRKKRRPYKTKNGYLQVDIRMDDGSVKRLYVHRLVALGFIPVNDEKPHVNHINGVKSCNERTNLEWCTPSENNLHAFRIGLSTPKIRACSDDELGDLISGMSLEEFRRKNPMARGTAKRIRDENGIAAFGRPPIRSNALVVAAIMAHPGTLRECARDLGISKSVIHRIKVGVSA